MSGALAPPDAGSALSREVSARLARFDRDELLALLADRDPWALCRAERPRADGLMGAWLREREDEDTADDDALLRWFESGAVPPAEDTTAFGEGALAGQLGRVLHASPGETRSSREPVLDRLLNRFERRKHPLGLGGGVKDVADVRGLVCLRGAWCVLTERLGDPRFLNAALKLAEWTRRTLPDPHEADPRPWHGLRAEVGPGRHDLSTRATRLHLAAVLRERRVVNALRGTIPAAGGAS